MPETRFVSQQLRETPAQGGAFVSHGYIEAGSEADKDVEHASDGRCVGAFYLVASRILGGAEFELADKRGDGDGGTADGGCG